MPTIIDSLLVTLGLDSSGFKKGAADATKEQEDFTKKSKRGNKELTDAEKKTEKERIAQGKSVKIRNKEFVDGLTRVRNTTLGLMAIFTAGKGLISFATNAITATAALGRMSENTDISAYELAGWGLAMKNVGGSAEGALAYINKVSEAVAAYKSGRDTQMGHGYFMAGGTDVGAFKNTKTLMIAQADQVKKLVDSIGYGAAKFKALNDMGIDADTFELFKKGGAEALKQMQTSAKITGINQDQVDTAKTAQVQMNNLMAKTEAAGKHILQSVLKPITEWYAKNEKDIDKWIKEFSAFLSNNTESGIDVLVAALKVFVELLKTAGALLKGMYELGISTGMITPIGDKGEEKGAISSIIGGAGIGIGVVGAVRNPFSDNGKMFRDQLYSSIAQMFGMGGGAKMAGAGFNQTNHVTIHAGNADAREVARIAPKAIADKSKTLTTQALGGTR